MELTVICVFAAGWISKKLAVDWWRAKKKRLARQAKREMEAEAQLKEERRHAHTWPQIMRLVRRCGQCQQQLVITPSMKS